jgi:hypothetical protein
VAPPPHPPIPNPQSPKIKARKKNRKFYMN